MENKKFKSGFVAIVGKPNSGKSTLLNTIIGKKVAIATYKKNTTRNQIRAIYNDEDSQIIFIDTPGFLKKSNILEERMQKKITESLKSVEVILYLLPFWSELDVEYLRSINFTKASSDSKKFLLLTKIDRSLNKNELILKIDEVNKMKLFDEIIPISSIKKLNISTLLTEIKKNIFDEIKYYDTDQVTEYDNQFYVSEILREKCLFNLKEEVPHHILVKVDEVLIEEDLVNINAEIIVDRETLKGIVIGKNGKMLSQINQDTIVELENYFDKKISLNTFVKVRKDWQKKESFVNFI